MKPLEQKAYDFLDRFIDDELLAADANINQAFVKDKLVNISGKDFLLNCWEESSDEGRIICVELRRKKMFILSEVFSLGVLMGEGIVQKLEQKDMWDKGF